MELAEQSAEANANLAVHGAAKAAHYAAAKAAHSAPEAASAAANAAANAAYAAHAFAFDATNADAAAAAAAAASAAHAAAKHTLSHESDRRTLQAIVLDFNTLSDLARAQNWSDSTPVPPSLFGPIWTDGPPPGWPIEVPAAPGLKPSLAFAKIAIKALIAPEVMPETVRDGLIELYRAMNEYHMASGAGVLTLEDFRRFVQAEVTAEV